MRTHLTRGRFAVAVLTAASLTTAACAGSDDDASGASPTTAGTAETTAAPATTGPATSAPAATTEPTTAPTSTGAPEVTEPAEFDGYGSLDSAYALDAEPKQQLIVVADDGTIAGRGRANDLGAVMVRGLEPGEGYTFRHVDGNDVYGSQPFTVLDPEDTPDQSLYDGQTLQPGLNYITVRDGVEIAATVRLPAGKTLADGPFPTVMEYSGYGTAAPGDLLGPDDQRLPKPDSSTAVGGALAPLLGFASVSVQMRGSGCSGGAFDLFGISTTLDGYDVVETIAAQDWVKANKVGMVGISFSGISQIFVAGSQPPSLAAITPLSITDDLYSTGYPGGIQNDGFASTWLADRVEDAKPAHRGGQPWAQRMIELGDEDCDDNQALHGFALTVESQLGGETFRLPGPFDERSPRLWAERIEVPTFLVGALQDEQTGGQWTRLAPSLKDNPRAWVTMINGTHVDSLGPATVGRWVEFIDLYVADELPSYSASVLGLSGALYDMLAGTPAAPVPPLRFLDAASTDAARTEFERDPRIRVLFDNGNSSTGPGTLGPVWEAGFESWPAAEVEPTAYYLGDDGAITPEPPAGASEVSFRPDPSARGAKTLPGTSEGDAWVAIPPYQWDPVKAEDGLGFTTEPLAEDTTLVGTASADLYLSSSAEDTDLQVTVSEVRPDGQEMYVQSGWLRASRRALDDERSDDLFAAPTYTAEDEQLLVDGESTLVRVDIGPLAHAFRAGSSIRLTITAPGGDRPRWTFDTPETDGGVVDTIALGGAQPSKVMLPVVPGLEAGAPLPPCPSLRGQPCRVFEPAGNGG
jgi:predicted acyl esterase